MKFILAFLIASQAFLMISGREFIFGDPIGVGSRHSNESVVFRAGVVNQPLDFTQIFTADGFIWSIRAVDLTIGGPGLGVSSVEVTEGGQGHHQATLRFRNTLQNQPVNFRVEVYAGVAMAKASMLFLTIAFFISYLLK